MNGHYTLAIAGIHHAQLLAHLFPGDGKEAVAIALCSKTQSDRRTSFLVQSIFPVPYAACTSREPHRVTWSPESVVPALTTAMNRGLSVVKIHSHPSGHDSFSHTDDDSDTEFFNSVFGWLDTDEPQASLVMLPNGEMFGRTVWPMQLGEFLDEIRVAGDDIQFFHRSARREAAPAHAIRIAQTFGENTYNLLRSLRIGVVGCSGTGSIVVEQLARNCIGELVLVDPDIVENKNLNRILNSTLEDAEQRRAKVDVARRAIDAMGLGTHVVALEADLMNRDVIRTLASCDVLIGCMDSIDGRHLLNKTASYHLIPLFDVGVRIDADGKGGIDQVCAAVHYIQPGGSSLLSRGVYTQADLDAAFLKRENPQLHVERLAEGYIRDARVDQPAVISINMQAAALAVNELLARLHPYRVDSNREYAYRRLVFSDPVASGDSSEGDRCPIFSAYMGWGAIEPPLGIQSLASRQEE